jgi:hypothetical protein
VKLADIVGYQLDMTHCAALRCLNRHLAGETLRPADTTALLLAREQPGCDQTLLGRLLAGNRSVGMKVASRLETRGLLTRGAGRDRAARGSSSPHKARTLSLPCCAGTRRPSSCWRNIWTLASASNCSACSAKCNGLSMRKRPTSGKTPQTRNQPARRHSKHHIRRRPEVDRRISKLEWRENP